jgi:hypothetical protein
LIETSLHGVVVEPDILIREYTSGAWLPVEISKSTVTQEMNMKIEGFYFRHP